MKILSLFLLCLYSCTSSVERPAPVLALNLAALPTPRLATYYDLTSFLEEYKEVYQPYAPLQNEVDFLQNLILTTDVQNIEKAFQRIKAQPDKSYWVYLFTLQQLLERQIIQSSKFPKILVIEREEDFIRTMKLISFMASSLDALSESKVMSSLARDVYIEISHGVYGRALSRETPRQYPNYPVRISPP